MTIYFKLSDGSYLASSDGNYISLLPDSPTELYTALYTQWVKEGMPIYFMYQTVVYMQTTELELDFIAVSRSANPERADGSRRWDGLYGPYGRQWWLNTHKGQPVS